MADLPAIGAVVGPIHLDRIAHGGHCVGRLDSLVYFVRHGLPGEDVRVRITEVAARFVRADVVEVLTPSDHRVQPPCPIAGQCGGCDFQHVDIAYQRHLKADVLAEQLAHLAGITWTGTVEPVQPADWHWRTRMHYFATPDGRPGLRRHRSHDVVALPPEGCRIAVDAIARPRPFVGPGLIAVAASDGALVVPDGDPHHEEVHEQAAGRSWTVAVEGFWQVHPRAAATLTDAVRTGLEPRSGDVALDLYCGVGLFAGMLVDAGCAVTGIEGSASAVTLARRNVPSARFLAGAVERTVASLPESVDLVVLDPPRKGAGRAVMDQVLARRPRRIAYVACDPAALARDLGIVGARYRLASLRAFDLFPNTHHLEAVAILERTS